MDDPVVADSIFILGWSAEITRDVKTGLDERVGQSHELYENQLLDRVKLIRC